ncbi:hypothetical protein POJ06DRAFT_8820 [Lipomyces tetrasporus]|uniref:Uncharacterized protein n=1 Tax=Lipomyces tetrasporus TaxID=54092 RepID=A0AAD7VV49_9ASCO|nr:uncharacterized protein POJ06DRAFT_8820 [Lipomyces tetrasporus]KAJ8103882.1 hypothetical protein POJ06DRAFT_8820 [Lipomyces tetrasporus]
MSSQTTQLPGTRPANDESPVVPPLYFTIIQDTTTDFAAAVVNATSESHKPPPRSRTYHPQVHYLFSDDADNTEWFMTATCVNGKAGKMRNERAIIVDFAADAKTVLRATSFSSDWQVTKAETSSLAMRSGATGGGIDIGKMLTIEGIGSGNANQKLVDGETRQSRQNSISSSRNGGRQADKSQAETELTAAFTYADLFAQTNLKLKRLLEQSPPDEYLKVVERLRGVSLRSTSPSLSEDDAPALNKSRGLNNQYDERGDSPYGLQSTIMQQSVVGSGSSLRRTATPDRKEEEDPAAFIAAVEKLDVATAEQPAPAENQTLCDNKDFDKTIVEYKNEPTNDDVSETLTTLGEAGTQPSTDEAQTRELHADTKQDSFASPWVN